MDEIIGRYRIQSSLGEGAQGRVLKAYDTILERPVALKFLQSQTSDIALKRIINEARAIARLSHANIVTLYDVDVHHSAPFFAMEYIDGRSLTTVLKAHPLGLSSAVQIIAALADGLSAAAKAGVLHGDIKPNNIMLTNDETLKIVDFGLATSVEADSLLQTLSSEAPVPPNLIGTLPYLAPEVIMGAERDERTDIFALGAVYYEILTGRRAFDASSPSAVLNQILNHHPPPIEALRPEVPAWLSALIRKMLDKAPNDRVQKMALVYHGIEDQGQQSFISRVSAKLIKSYRDVSRATALVHRFRLFLGLATLVTVFWAGSIIWQQEAPLISAQLEQGFQVAGDFTRGSNFQTGQDIFEGILTDAPNHAAANAGMSLVLIREYTSAESDPATLRRASAYAEAALASDPHLALANIAAAWVAEFNGEYAQAHTLYDTATVLDPYNIFLLEGRARTLRKQGRIDQAMEVLRTAIERHPNQPVFHSGYATLLLQSGAYADAEASYRIVLEKAPDNPFAYSSLAQALHMQGRTSEAIIVIQRGLQVGPNADLYNNLGTYLFFQGHYQKAASAFERTLELDGNTHDYLYWANLGDALRWSSPDRREANKAYRRALQLLNVKLEQRPDHFGLNSRHALYSAKSGDTETATSAVEYVLSQQVVPSIQLYRGAVTVEILGQRSRALALLEQALNKGYPLVEISNDPELTALRQDKAYQEILANGE